MTELRRLDVVSRRRVGAGDDGARGDVEALSGELHWFRAADILGWSPRTLRRWRERYEKHGYVGLVDKRLHRPSVRRVAAPEVERLLRLYRERYQGFNVRHFHQIARREHGVTVSYSFLKQTLQAAGLVKKQRVRGRHRRRREPRACFGELLHLDGSMHAWFTLDPEARPRLIAVSDDATKRCCRRRSIRVRAARRS
jgi:transposase